MLSNSKSKAPDPLPSLYVPYTPCEDRPGPIQPFQPIFQLVIVAFTGPRVTAVAFSTTSKCFTLMSLKALLAFYFM